MPIFKHAFFYCTFIEKGINKCNFRCFQFFITSFCKESILKKVLFPIFYFMMFQLIIIKTRLIQFLDMSHLSNVDDEIQIAEIQTETLNRKGNLLYSQRIDENYDIDAYDSSISKESCQQSLEKPDLVQGPKITHIEQQNEGLQFEEVNFFNKTKNRDDFINTQICQKQKPSNDQFYQAYVNRFIIQKRETLIEKYQTFLLVFKEKVFTGKDLRQISRQRTKFFFPKIIKRMTAVLIEQSRTFTSEQARNMGLFLYQSDSKKLKNIEKSYILSHEKYFYTNKSQYLHKLLSFRFESIDEKNELGQENNQQKRGPQNKTCKKSSTRSVKYQNLVDLISLQQLTEGEFQKVFDQKQMFKMVINSKVSRDAYCYRRIYYASLIFVFKKIRYEHTLSLNQEWSRFWSQIQKRRQIVIDKEQADLTNQQRRKLLKWLCSSVTISERRPVLDDNFQQSSQRDQLSVSSNEEISFLQDRSEAHFTNSNQVSQVRPINQTISGNQTPIIQNQMQPEEDIQKDKELLTPKLSDKTNRQASQQSTRQISLTLETDGIIYDCSKHFESQSSSIQLEEFQQIPNNHCHSLCCSYDIYDTPFQNEH